MVREEERPPEGGAKEDVEEGMEDEDEDESYWLCGSW